MNFFADLLIDITIAVMKKVIIGVIIILGLFYFACPTQSPIGDSGEVLQQDSIILDTTLTDSILVDIDTLK